MTYSLTRGCVEGLVPSLKASLASLLLYVVIKGLAVVPVPVRGLYRNVVTHDLRRKPPQP